MGTASTGRPRLPHDVRRALVAVEAAFTSGTSDEYVRALEQLTAACADLDQTHRDLVNQHLSETAARFEAVSKAARLGVSVRSGRYRLIEVLPGAVELIEASDPPGMLAVLPYAKDDDTEDVIWRVYQAREAIFAGRCPQCLATLDAASPDQLTLVHRSGCALSDTKIARARESTRHP